MTRTDNIPQIGPIIQRRRKDAALTLQQLASLSGISKSMLSEVERGETNPTFAVLWAVTKALRVDLAELLHNDAAKPLKPTIEVVSSIDIPVLSSANDQCRLRILSAPSMAGRLEWYGLEIDPGGCLESAAHATGTVEHLIAYSPGLAVRSGDCTCTLRNGEVARYPVDVPHTITNTSRSVGRAALLVIFRGVL